MAYLNGIDVASHQAGIDAAGIAGDFVIAKATQGTSYVNPCCVAQAEGAEAGGKCVGVYHYVSGGNAEREADFFLDNVRNWIGKYMLCLDWESNQNSAWGDESYLRRVAQRVIDRTGIPPMIYVQASHMAQVKPIADALDCGLWIAQYASNAPTGYQATPWNEGAYSCAIRQYTSSGRLAGWSGNLDLDKFYGDRSTWAKYANPRAQTAPVADPRPQDPGQPVNDMQLCYRAHVAGYGWLDAVRDGQTAGTTGRGVQLEAVKLTPPDGLKLTAKIHVEDKGWVDYEGIERGASSGEGSSENDPIIGTVGEGLRAEAIEFDVVENATGRTLKYQVHVADEGWTGWVTAGHATGSVGMGKQIEAIQMKLE